jgi:hypothetical protein
MRITGTVTKAVLTRGFAFLIGDEDGLEYFLQVNEFIGTWDGETIREGAKFDFVPAVIGGKRNGLRATRARAL